MVYTKTIIHLSVGESGGYLVNRSYEENPREKFIFLNNKHITIDQKHCFGKLSSSVEFIFMQDLLSKDGKFSSLVELYEKFGLKVDYT